MASGGCQLVALRRITYARSLRGLDGHDRAASLAEGQTGYIPVFAPFLFESFENRCNTLPHADAHGGQTQLTVILLHYIQQGRGYPCAGTAQRMT